MVLYNLITPCLGYKINDMSCVKYFWGKYKYINILENFIGFE